MKAAKRNNTRRKLLIGGGLGLLASVWALIPFRTIVKRKAKPEMTKMLSEDGQLITIDASLLATISKGKKATNNEIQQFVKK